jgi:hypothetical protein
MLSTSHPAPALPEPYATPSVANFPTVVGWPEGSTPRAPEGFEVTPYATGLDYPRWFHVLPNGDVLVSEARSIPKPGQDPEAPELHSERLARSHGLSANRITLLRDADGDGMPEVRETFLANLSQPFGMALLGERLYVANTDGVLVFPYRTGQTRIDAPGRKILDLPAGGYNNHWTRNILVGPGGKKLYVTVGSASNIGEFGMDEERRRACILEIDPDGGNERLYASGLRNPVGLDLGARDRHDVDGRERARRAGRRPRARLRHERARGRVLRLALRLLAHRGPPLAGQRPTSSRRRSPRTWPWARTRPRWASTSTAAPPSRSATAAGCSSASTARGTGRNSPATRSPSSRSRAAAPPAR